MIREMLDPEYTIRSMPRPNSRKKRIETAVAYIELIMSHCIKIIVMRGDDSFKHWCNEVATHILNLSRVRTKDKRSIDTEIIDELVDEVMQDAYKEADIIGLKYGRDIELQDYAKEAIADFIKEQYQNVIFGGKDYRAKDIIDAIKVTLCR